MTHRRIAEVRLLPRHVPVRCHGVHGCASDATDWVVSPDGFAILATCAQHGEDINSEYRDKLMEDWTLAPIYHNEPGNVTLPRTL